jgi:hypothetical protein
MHHASSLCIILQQSLLGLLFATSIFYARYVARGGRGTAVSSGCLDPDHVNRQEFRNAGLDGPLRSHRAFLVIAVISAPGNVERRRVIQKTWLNLEKHLKKWSTFL